MGTKVLQNGKAALSLGTQSSSGHVVGAMRHLIKRKTQRHVPAPKYLIGLGVGKD